MTKTAGELIMERETRVFYGSVPHSLTEERLNEQNCQMRNDQFLLRGVGHHYFFYQKGRGITIERGPHADCSEETLWLNGSMHSAVASMNGFLPIHASAVAIEGRVFAFTGPAGAGKSTIVAALGELGLPMFCDDTLVLDLSHPDQIGCLPGHKRLKLTPEALRLTSALAEEKVSLTVEKYYARPSSGDVRVPLPLAQLIFLEEGLPITIEPIIGALRFLKIQDEHYTASLFAQASQFDRPQQFAHLTRLARQIPMANFVRPRDTRRFTDGVAFAAQYVRDSAKSGPQAQSCPR